MDQVDILKVSNSRRRRQREEDDDDNEVEEERQPPRFWLARRKTSMVVLQRTNTINSLTNQQVALVGHRMVYVAQDFVRAELAKAQKAAAEQQQEVEKQESSNEVNRAPFSLSFPTIKPKQQQQQSKSKKTAENSSNLLDNEQVDFWLQAQRRLEGGDWQYVLVETPIPNAFVAEIIPRRIFVTTGLLESLAAKQNKKDPNGKKQVPNGFVSNSDELALVLGHEVSHLILGHVSKRNQLEALLRTLEVLLLSLDPTEGLLSLYIVTLLAAVRTAVSASYSRDDEREADELGMILCAMAGCNLTKACHVFYKMAQSEGGIDHASVMSSHPPTLERYKFLTEKAKELTEAQQQTHSKVVVQLPSVPPAGNL
jgi:Zn-dependent protease with chaperone function